jgi:Ca-activated chloride channel homolog
MISALQILRSLSIMKTRPLRIGAACVALAAIVATPAFANTVRLDAQLGQSAVVAADGKHVYLRISLEGLALAHAGKRAATNVGLVIDRSGSMEDDNKIGKARDGAIMALERLSEDDVASVVAFDHNVDVLLPAQHVTDHGRISRIISDLTSGGNTALYAGTQEGLHQISKYLDRSRVNRLILISDGLANVGPSSPQEVAALGMKAAAKGISITTIGLGLGYNEDLMTKLAYASDGNHAFVERSDQLVDIFNKEFGNVLSVVAHDLIIRIDCHRGFKPTRLLGREAEIKDGQVTFGLNQLYGKQQKYAVLELEVPKGASVGDLSVADVELSYSAMGETKRITDRSHVSVRITPKAEDEHASLNPAVMGDITTQLANEVHEKAVDLRDKGQVDEAKKLLNGYAKELDQQAASGKTAAAAAAPIAKQFRADADKLEDEAEWNKNRKVMRAQEYKSKTMQSY